MPGGPTTGGPIRAGSARRSQGGRSGGGDPGDVLPPLLGFPKRLLMPFRRVWLVSGFSRTLDTAGEFGWSVQNRGFPFPTGLILPRFRPIDCWREFASSITLDDPGPPTDTESHDFRGILGHLAAASGCHHRECGRTQIAPDLTCRHRMGRPAESGGATKSSGTDGARKESRHADRRFSICSR